MSGSRGLGVDVFFRGADPAFLRFVSAMAKSPANANRPGATPGESARSEDLDEEA